MQQQQLLLLERETSRIKIVFAKKVLGGGLAAGIDFACQQLN